MKKLVLTKNTLVYITIFSILLISSYAGLVDFDYYWQSFLGKCVLSGDFNGVDKLTWGTLGKSVYYDHEWLTNVLFYLSTLVGIKGITLLKICISVFLGCTFIYLIKTNGKQFNLISYIYLVLFLLLFSVIFLKVKAYCISVGFLVLEVAYLNQYKKTRYNRYFVYMLILCILWTNMHSGSLVLYFGVAGVFWLVELFKDWKSIIFGFLCLCSTLLNPYGYKLLIFNIQHNNDAVMKKYIGDWKSLDLKTSLGLFCFIFLVIVLSSIYIVSIRDNLFSIIMVLIVMSLGLQSVRHFIYLVPFFLLLILNNNFNIALDKTIVCGVASAMLCLALIVNFKAFTCKTYNVDYAMDYMSSALKDLLIETNSANNDGLYTDEVYIWDKELKTFISGAFPNIRQRFLDSYLLRYCASVEQIESIIDYYDLTKFCFIKDNVLIDYYTIDCVLYDYLSNNDDYVCLYDSDFYCYFVRKDITY